MGIETKAKSALKIGEHIKESLYNWIMHHPQVLQSPIANYCLKMKIDDYTEPQPVPNFLLQVYVRELHNNIVSATKDGEKKRSNR